jgi:hypothetical protein
MEGKASKKIANLSPFETEEHHKVPNWAPHCPNISKI